MTDAMQEAGAVWDIALAKRYVSTLTKNSEKNLSTGDAPLSINRAATTVLFGYKYNHPAFWSYVEKLIIEIDTSSPIKRRRGRSMRQHGQIRDALGNVLLTLYKSHLYFLDAPVGINLNRNFYTKRAVRYRKFDPGYDAVIAIYSGLIRLGLIHIIKKGSFNRTEDRRDYQNTSTRIIPSQKILDDLWDLRVNLDEVKYDLNSETIILRKAELNDGKKSKIEIDYIDTPHTKKMRNDVFAINMLLERTHIDIELTDTQFSKMQRELLNKRDANYQPVDLTRKHFKRVFNEDFKNGGRFYGTWWQQIGRKWRRFIKINGSQTIELDYKTLHPGQVLFVLEKWWREAGFGLAEVCLAKSAFS